MTQVETYQLLRKTEGAVWYKNYVRTELRFSENTLTGDYTMPVQYKVVIKPDITDTPSGQISKKGMRKFAKDLEEGLNDIGNEGWRLVICYGLGGRYFIFARES